MMVNCASVVGSGWFGASRSGAALATGSGAEVAATAAGLDVSAGAGEVAAAGFAGSVAAHAFSVAIENAVKSVIFFMSIPSGNGVIVSFAFGNAFAARVRAALPTG